MHPRGFGKRVGAEAQRDGRGRAGVFCRTVELRDKIVSLHRAEKGALAVGLFLGSFHLCGHGVINGFGDAVMGFRRDGKAELAGQGVQRTQRAGGFQLPQQGKCLPVVEVNSRQHNDPQRCTDIVGQVGQGAADAVRCHSQAGVVVKVHARKFFQHAAGIVGKRHAALAVDKHLQRDFDDGQRVARYAAAPNIVGGIVKIGQYGKNTKNYHGWFLLTVA